MWSNAKKLVFINSLKTTLLSTRSSPHITSVQYCGGCSVHWRLFSTLGDNISTVGDSFSSVEVAQYIGG